MLLWTSSASAFNGLKVAASAVPAHPLHSMASRLPHLLRLRLRLRPRDREVELTARARELRGRHCGKSSESGRRGGRVASPDPGPRQIRTSGDIGGPVLDDGDLVDGGDLAEHVERRSASVMWCPWAPAYGPMRRLAGGGHRRAPPRRCASPAGEGGRLEGGVDVMAGKSALATSARTIAATLGSPNPAAAATLIHALD